MMDNLYYRPLEVEDFETYLLLQEEALQNSPELFGSDYESYQAISKLNKEQLFEQFLDYPYNFLLACFNSSNMPIGMIGFSSKKDKTNLRHKGEIWGLYVKPDYRTKSIATNLIQHVVDSAKENLGTEQILLKVAVPNTKAYSLYLKLGFLVYGTEIRALKVDNQYVDEYLMIKLL
jgi:ribosomal protein S18 acetylase RimI-like enzyme